MNESLQPQALGALLNEFQDEYKELSDDWRAIDQKADGALRFAATLLGATAAVVIHSTWHAQLCLANCFLLSGVALCVASAVMGLLAARVRSPTQPPRGTDSYAAVDALLVDSPSSAQSLAAFHKQQLHRWATANRDLRSQANEKAGYLEYAHLTAACGVIMIVLAVAIHIYVPVAKDGATSATPVAGPASASP